MAEFKWENDKLEDDNTPVSTSYEDEEELAEEEDEDLDLEDSDTSEFDY